MARPSGRRTAQFRLPQGQPQPEVPSLENNFTGGLKTEYTGLNFPENSCTSTSNCVFTRVGNVTRRGGIDYETGYTLAALGSTRFASAMNTYLWTNAGGDGNAQVYVVQIGGNLFFYQVSNATLTVGPSSTQLIQVVSLSTFIPAGGASPNTVECQFTSGNGYLFVFHPNCEPFYCTFNAGIVTALVINIKVRDFSGIPEPGILDNFRPLSLSNEHLYNLQNQGWLNSPTAAWNATSAGAQVINFGNMTFTLDSGITGPGAGQVITYTGQSGRGQVSGGGIVVSYAAPTLVVNITTINPTSFAGDGFFNWGFNFPGSSGQISTFHTAATAYPSNADIWWTFKDSTDIFNPATTLTSVTLGTGPAPKGYYLLPAFNQNRASASGLGGLTSVSTTVRPKTGAWFQGRVWYAGVDASQPAAGDEPFYTWTENIYFSQIVINTSQFEKCYQLNDPTSETLNALLPSDGGVIQIQGCGSIYKLFPVLNGLLVFASNGIWFITGGSSIGFSATDFTVSKISGEHAISGTSFVDVQGYPIFWNYEAIYAIQPGVSQTSGQKSMEVKNLTLETIKQFYQAIPNSSKLYARGSYNHITGIIQWIYRSTPEVDVTTRYNFDSVLNLLTYTGAFYPWSISTNPNGPFVNAITYMELPNIVNPALANIPAFKYFTSVIIAGNYVYTFAQEINFTNYVDWAINGNSNNYTSFFETAYRLKGLGQRRTQPEYVYVYSEIPISQYTIQGIWNYAISGNSGKFSTIQYVNNNQPLFGKTFRRHRIRGQGYVLQFLIGSSDGQPFNIAGWSVLDTVNAGP